MKQGSGQRYEIVSRLDAGGMAEVFRGRAVSIEGFEKQVAIKRVLPNLAKNRRFVNMFLDEARLSLHLNHANIVSVFDLARSGESYFIVMEFVEGTNLRRLIEARSPFPVAISVFITLEMCKGLAYAHTRRDRKGEPLHIVHRDVSPPNVLISRRGEVKLVDFGLAKAKMQLESTDPGVVKGKFSYLSPEAARGESLDHRADIFATGIILWEMLAGRRLFQGEADADTLQLVKACEVPPLRALNADVPPELEEIIRRALVSDPEGRFQSARDLGRALSQWLARQSIAVDSFDLENFVTEYIDEGAVPREVSTDGVLQAVIEDEMNRLTRVSGAHQPESTSASLPGASRVSHAGAARRTSVIHDPTTWDLGLDDDVEVPDAPPIAASEPTPTPVRPDLPPMPAKSAPAGAEPTPPQGVNNPALRLVGEPPPRPATVALEAAPVKEALATAPAPAQRGPRVTYAERGRSEDRVIAPSGNEMPRVRSGGAAPRAQQAAAARSGPSAGSPGGDATASAKRTTTDADAQRAPASRPAAAEATEQARRPNEKVLFGALVLAIVLVSVYLLSSLL